MAKIEEFISQKVKEFILLSDMYCQLVEESGKHSPESFFEKILPLLPKIYLRALTLPEVEVMYSAGEEQYLGDREVWNIRKLLKNVSLAHETYPGIGRDRVRRQYALTRETLSDTLSDLYQELKNFSLWYKEGTLESMNDSIGVCSEHFKTFWGLRLIDLLRFMHEIRFVPAPPELSEEPAEDLPEDEEFDPDEMGDFSEEKGI